MSGTSEVGILSATAEKASLQTSTDAFPKSFEY